MKVRIPGYTTLTGSPVTILKMMQEARMLDDLAGDDLIQEIRSTAWRAFEISLQVSGGTYAERAESLLREMDKNSMIEIEEEE
jgi:hypothetical protein